MLDESLLRSRCQTHRLVGRKLFVHNEVASTNDCCHELADDPANTGTVVFAERQTTGRGQQGRVWSAPSGSSLLMSVLLFPEDEFALPQFLTAWSAVAIADLLRINLELSPTIKWPNDILLDGKKTCGILVERRVGTVVGIGLNVSIADDQFPASLRLPATSLESHAGRSLDRNELAAGLLARLDALLHEAKTAGPQRLFDRWSDYRESFGAEPVAAATADETYFGRLLDLRPDRGAILETAAGQRVQIAASRLLRVTIGGSGQRYDVPIAELLSHE